jgi:hypothetical protein
MSTVLLTRAESLTIEDLEGLAPGHQLAVTMGFIHPLGGSRFCLILLIIIGLETTSNVKQAELELAAQLLPQSFYQPLDTTSSSQ